MLADYDVQRNVMVPMRDGVALATDIYRPRSSGPLPVLLSRTTYGKDMVAATGLPFLQQDYAVAFQDCRGCFASEGSWTPFFCEADDGHDTIEWLAAQPWSSGAIGIFGGSYSAYVQWLAALARPPHLRAISAYVSPSGVNHSWVYGESGLYQLSLALPWAMLCLATAMQTGQAQAPGLEGCPSGLDVLRESMAVLIGQTSGTPMRDEADRRANALMARRPLADVPELATGAPWYLDWLTHDANAPFWRAVDPAALADQIEVPALQWGGWYDLFVEGGIRNFLAMRETGATPEARTGQRLVIGPWCHSFGHDRAGDLVFGQEALRNGPAMFGNGDLELRWFDHWIKGNAEHPLDTPPVRYFVLGANEWRSAETWPPRPPGVRPLHLGAGLDGTMRCAGGRPSPARSR